MRIVIELQGPTPLMMHNERLSLRDNPFARQIAEITAKGVNQTDADKELVAKLEWYGGLYTDAAGNVVLPTKNVIKSFAEAGTITKSGKKIKQGITPYAMDVPLIIPDPLHQDTLWEKPQYRDARPVKIGRGKILRTRPIFHRWAATLDAELLTDVLNIDQAVSIAELAGRAVGLCDARNIGYGRFTAKLKKLTAPKRAPSELEAV